MKNIILLLLVAISPIAFADVSIQGASGGAGGIAGGGDHSLPEDRIEVVPSKIRVNIAVRCSSTNTRWTGRASSINNQATHLVIGVPFKQNSQTTYIAFEFPSSLIVGSGGSLSGVKSYNVGSVWTDSYRNKPILELTNPHVGKSYLGLSFPSLGENVSIDKNNIIYRQVVGGRALSASMNELWGHKGYPTIKYSHSDNSGSLNINAAFTMGFYDSTDHGNWDGLSGCGYYTSPLMVFFDDKRPTFQNASDFPLSSSEYVSWPEANAPGYFVALDQNKDNLITEARELFGNGVVDDQEFSNGFEALGRYDSNKDKVINAKDKMFNKLVLWKDVNGDGVGQVSEQISLYKKVKEISLKAKEVNVRYGKLAKETHKTKFTFLDEKGKLQKGDIIDIWFTSLSESSVAHIKPELVKRNKAKRAKVEALAKAKVKKTSALDKKNLDNSAEVKKDSLVTKVKKWFKVSRL